MVEKKLGYIKYHLGETGKHELKNIKILRSKHMVTLNDKKVAWLLDGEWHYTKVVKDIQKQIDEALELWVSKRYKEPETDSDA